MSQLSEAKEKGRYLEDANSARVNICKAQEDLYWMRWGEEGKVSKQIENVKITRTPRARNAIKGAHRLLVATDPVIAVTLDTNRPAAVKKANAIERFLKAMWFASGRISGIPIHNDAVLSALMYGEVIIGVNSVKELIGMSGTSKGLKQRLEAIQERTPYLFEVLNPKYCYIERSKLFGVTALYQRKTVRAGELMDKFGDRAMKTVKAENRANMTRDTEFTYNDLLDLDRHTVWLDQGDSAIVEEEYGLPFLPVAAAVSDGSNLFDKEEEKREPFLWTLSKSGIVDRENLLLTVLHTMTFAIGSNPMFVDYTMNPENAPAADFSQPGGVIHYRVGESRNILAKQVIDPSMLTMWEIDSGLEEQSTIYQQTLGAPLGKNAAYSMVSLLSQAGRLPLVSPQRQVGWAMGEAMEIALRWAKQEKGASITAVWEGDGATLRKSEIPSHVDVSVQLEVDLPQDRLNAANAANVLAQGQSPMVSKRWARENVLLIGQSDDMDKEIFKERSLDMQFQQFMQMRMMQAALAAQAAQQGMGSGSGIPGQAQTPPGAGMQPGQGNMPMPQEQGPAEPMEPQEPMPPMVPPNMQPGEEME